MSRLMIAVSALALLSACGDGQPFDFGETASEQDQGDESTANNDLDGDGEPDVDSSDGVTAGGLPPGTPEPTQDGSIRRYEPQNDLGGGLIVSPVIYDAENDTFTVDNLAFDGANTYRRGTAVSQLGGYAVYEADVVVSDSITGTDVNQIVPYRAILGISRNSVRNEDGERVPRSSFAIVRTGGYVGYGFGGFVYEREGGVVLPDTGQATFSGGYAGLRVYNDRSGLNYTRGQMSIDFDFEDFNSNEGIKGIVANRRVFDINGDPVSVDEDTGSNLLPAIRFVLEEGGRGVDDNGEATGSVFSTTVTDEGALETFEEGTYYLVLSGDLTDPNDGGEVTGVMVLETTDGLEQETGGFILYR